MYYKYLIKKITKIYEVQTLQSGKIPWHISAGIFWQNIFMY